MSMLAHDRPGGAAAEIRPGGAAVGVPTPAGRFFGPLPDGPLLDGSVPDTEASTRGLWVAPAGMFVVHVPVGPRGFEPLGRATTSAGLAAMIADCPEWAWRPVVLCLTGEPVAVARAAGQAPELLPTLGVPVYVSAAPVMLGDGMLVTSGTFHCWSLATPAAGQPASVRHCDVGSVLSAMGPLPARRMPPHGAALAIAAATELPVEHPEPPGPDLRTDQGAVDDPAGTCRPEPLALLDPAPNLPEALTVTVPEGRPPDPRADAEPEPEPGAPFGPGREPPDPTVSVPSRTATATDRPGVAPARTWTPPAGPIQPGDREALRRILGWRYEAHVRAVIGLLALQPGMRSSVAREEDVAALVAVRAVLSDPDRGVRAFLRGERPSGDDGADLTVLLRCAQAGLELLPVVRAPVFVPCTEGDEVAHQPGQVLVEPAFLVATAAPAVPTGRTEHVIWSSTGRRVDGLMTDDVRADAATRLVFSAGSRFAVIQEIAGPHGVPRVLLHERGPDRDGRAHPGPSEHVLQRLRQAAERPADATAAGTPRAGEATPTHPPFLRPEPPGAFR